MRKPKGFRPAEGVRRADLSNTPPPFLRPVVLKGKQKAGMDYEARGHIKLSGLFAEAYLDSPWFTFTDRRDKGRWCQPDGLIFDLHRNRITIVEFKLKHCPRAWWQLHKLYLPVIKAAFGSDWEFCLVEICRTFDPATPFEGTIKRVKDLEYLHAAPVTNVFYLR